MPDPPQTRFADILINHDSFYGKSPVAGNGFWVRRGSKIYPI
jgi:hypothetical protein